MHLLATQAQVIDGAAEAVDLGQSPGDIVILSAADSELSALARGWDGLDSRLSLRLATLLQLQHNLSVDMYIEKTLRHARLVVLRLLGGAEYWRYGLAEVEAACRRSGIALAVLPGDAHPDPALMAHATLDMNICERMRQYLVQGGPDNIASFLQLCRSVLGEATNPAPARPAPDAGLFWPGRRIISVSDLRSLWAVGAPIAAIAFYRSVRDGGQTAPVESLIAALTARGINALPVFVTSLKDPVSAAFVQDSLRAAPPDVIINATSFAASSGGSAAANPFAAFDCPVLQVVFAGTSQEAWEASPQGLGPRDLAMNVVLPELDGRIMTRAVSFKAEDHWHAATQCRIVTYRPLGDRIDFVADQAARWARLRRMPARQRKVAIILANYPNRDGRIGNGVGYDTPASTIAILRALERAGYAVDGIPADGNGLIEELLNARSSPLPRDDGGEGRVRRPLSVTDAFCTRLAAKSHPSPRHGDDRVPACAWRDPLTLSPAVAGERGRMEIDTYSRLFQLLPESIRLQVMAQWGVPQDDPSFRDGAFQIPVRTYGNIAVGIQPARGYDIDPKSTYHDPALVPPHGYFAFYFWLRHQFGAEAIIHNGKHGNLEWLPGKATALSPSCYPEAVLGPLPQLYPFIVNDPGEGTQAKRRTSAVIIDHLTPPLTRAETYGPLKDLEALVDEYYLASGLDRRRIAALRENILDLTRSHRLDIDAGFTGEDETDLQRLDAYLCDLKEAQIRDGLHILGSSPEGRLEADLLVALARVPRGLGEGGNQSLIRALACDLGLADFDPLACVMAEVWTGPRPNELADVSGDPWRTNGDTVERLELLATRLVGSGSAVGEATRRVLDEIVHAIRPALRDSAGREIEAVLAGLDGRFVAPGPSGAPTRGRLDVLPTGRNFFSIDNRTVPTPTAWALGRKSAEDLLARHFQDFGRYPRAIGLSAWGTSNMRTGGDDIAQALALIGVEPKWEPSSWRISGFETIPVPKLGRPRVDVTLRISGFFRDAFPQQIELLDKAMRAVGGLDEGEGDNPIAARMRGDAAALRDSGVPEDEARHIAGYRIFGSKPGAYGAGLQALIDERIWRERADLARAYVTWGSYAYGARDCGVNDRRQFEERLKRIEAVVHNQDNREHDLLDSDDYYQFEGGMSAAVEYASGARPRVYHNDHSRPERPVIRTLEEEIGRVMRSRVVNPKWIAGVKRHGYKGAFEIAATVDYMFAFAATTGAVKTHHFDLAYEAYIDDEETRDFIARNNPAALAEIAQRFEEAIARGLWSPRSNSAYDRLRSLSTELVQ